MDQEELKQRTKDFGLRTIRLVSALPKSDVARTIGRQLLRCGTSVGANYRAACRARSAAEFVAKLGIVIEEADESGYWLELVLAENLLLAGRVEPLLKEASELVAIMVSSSNTVRERTVAVRRSVNQKSAIKNLQSVRGYTLIEVLVASSLFVGVLMIGTLSFASTARIRERVTTIELVSDAGRLVSEQVVRQARDARGLRTDDGAFVPQFAPFRFIGGTRQEGTDLRQTAVVQVADFERVGDRSVGSVMRVELVPHPSLPTLGTLQATVTEYSASPTPIATQTLPAEQLLPDSVGIVMDSFHFIGLGHEDTTTSQPFLQLEGTLVALDGETVSSTVLPLRTGVTSRAFVR